MMQRSYLRMLFGVCIGAFAGISLVTGIVPFVLARLFGINSFQALIAVQGFIIPTVILWAFGGGLVGWQGGSSIGGFILGVCGAITGAILGLFAFEGVLAIVTAGFLSGLIYGAVGGLILGYAFPKTIAEV